MPIELIRPQDPALAASMYATGRRAFAKDGLQAALFPPKLHNPSDPDEEHRFRIKELGKRLISENAWTIFAVDEDVKDEDGGVRVLGYASWFQPEISSAAEDKGGVPPGEVKNEEDEGWVEDGDGNLRGDGVKFPKCMDGRPYRQLETMLKDSKRVVLGEPAKPTWCTLVSFIFPIQLSNLRALDRIAHHAHADLRSLAVDPDFSGRGIATRLVQWGIDKAKEDNVPAFLESSPAALSLYKRMGFVVRLETPPLDNGHDLTLMVLEPGEKK